MGPNQPEGYARWARKQRQIRRKQTDHPITLSGHCTVLPRETAGSRIASVAPRRWWEFHPNGQHTWLHHRAAWTDDPTIFFLPVLQLPQSNRFTWNRWWPLARGATSPNLIARCGKARLHCDRKRHACPRGSCRGDPLIVAVREAAFKIRLNPDGAGFHMPRAIRGLRAKKVV